MSTGANPPSGHAAYKVNFGMNFGTTHNVDLMQVQLMSSLHKYSGGRSIVFTGKKILAGYTDAL